MKMNAQNRIVAKPDDMLLAILDRAFKGEL
jgi:hypothetical protein